MTHKDLEVWKKSVEFVTNIYRVTCDFPKEEQYGLTSQIRRAAISIPSNIAEGATRKGKIEFKQFIYIALASGSEIETLLIISKNLNFIKTEIFNDLIKELTSIQRMLQGLIKSLN
jgi:four helix bundle protein